MPLLTRPDGSAPEDFHLSRRTLGALIFTGYAAAALSAHADPIITDTAGLKTDNIFVPRGDELLPAYIARPDGPGRHPAVLVVSEIFGVHAYIQDICRRLAKLGYVAIAPAFSSGNWAQAIHETAPPQQKPVMARALASTKGWASSQCRVAPTSPMTWAFLAVATIFMICGKSVSTGSLAPSGSRKKKAGAMAT